MRGSRRLRAWRSRRGSRGEGQGVASGFVFRNNVNVKIKLIIKKKKKIYKFIYKQKNKNFFIILNNFVNTKKGVLLWYKILFY